MDININATGNEMEKAGLGFGNLVQKVGEAVASTTVRLNQTGANMASTLATTQVDVIAAEETIYKDDGTRDKSIIHTRKLPLINFIDPVFYEWANVRLQGTFSVDKFTNKMESHTNKWTTSDKSGQAGLFVILGGGRTTFDYESNSTDQVQTDKGDSTFGRIRMNAQLRPKTDIGVPKPRLSVQGPQISILQGEIKDVMTGTALTGRTMNLLISYTKAGGSPISGKDLSIETDGVPWCFTGASVTDSSGNVAIKLKRDFIGDTPDTSPVDCVVTVRKGLVSNSSVFKV